jgi:ABC-2 type transport system permease protein
MLTMLPSVLLSGYIAPRETLPGALYLFSEIFPVTHFIKIIRGIVVRGAGLSDMLPSVGALLLLAAVLITASMLRFRKSAS